MSTYTVKYLLPGKWFWRTLKNIKGDGIMSDANYPMRFFLTDKEERIEIPIPGTIFRFSSERFLTIHSNLEKESGQNIKTDTKI